MNKTFLFQINVTRDCNLRCTHCYISTDKKVSSKFMTEEQYIETFKQIRDYMKKIESSNIYSLADIHVIGGEPTMLGLEFYKNTMPKVREIIKEIPQNVRLGIVSNLITQDAVAISKEFDYITTSYEYNTRFVSEKGTPKPSLERKWVDNINQLQADGRRVDITMAVTKYATDLGAKEILNHFYDYGFRSVHLGFFIPSGDGLLNILDVFPMFEETSKFMMDATDWYLERYKQEENLFINPINSMMESIYNNEPLDDIICPIIPGSLDIDWNGNTVTCIEAGGEVSADSLGNIFNSSVTQILESRKYKKERNKAIVTKPACYGCEEFNSCQSACGILHDYWNGKGECPGFKQFIKYVRNKIEVENIKPKSYYFNNREESGAHC